MYPPPRRRWSIVPWARGTTQVSEENAQGHEVGARNPFDGVFHKTTVQDQTGSVVYSEFIRNVFAKTPSDIALFVDRGVASPSAEVTPQHIFLPFIGGPDDRLALSFVVQPLREPIDHRVSSQDHPYGIIFWTDECSQEHCIWADCPRRACLVRPRPSLKSLIYSCQANTAADTIYPQATVTHLSSNTADNILWDRYTTSPPSNLSAALVPCNVPH